jgi:hypothetical protein
MSDLELLLALLVIMLALVVLARRIGLGDPIVLVTAGLGLAILPVWPEADLEPALVFTVLLPPIRFAATYGSSWRDFRLAGPRQLCARRCGQPPGRLHRGPGRHLGTAPPRRPGRRPHLLRPAL